MSDKPKVVELPHLTKSFAEMKPNPLNSEHLQELFSAAIDGAIAFGFQGENAPPEGHWLRKFWEHGYEARGYALKAAATPTPEQPQEAVKRYGWSTREESMMEMRDGPYVLYSDYVRAHPPLSADTLERAAKEWPFVESPGEFAQRIRDALSYFDHDMVAAVRHVLIENPPEYVYPRTTTQEGK